jgi:hypothetical protein
MEVMRKDVGVPANFGRSQHEFWSEHEKKLIAAKAVVCASR